jgi:hypothetical protein
MSLKGLVWYCIPMLLANIGMSINGVDKNAIMVFNIAMGIAVGPWFLTGRIFDGDENE